MTLKPSMTLAGGRYILREQIGEGGMGSVWRAQKRGIEGFHKDIVLKVMNAGLESPDARRQFLNEARLTAHLHHPNLIEIYDLGQDGSIDYIAMELIEGMDLARLLARQLEHRDGPFPWPIAATIIRHACVGLHYAHNKQDPDGKALDLIHRDLKPGNILLSKEGFVKVIDFGIAKSQMNEVKTETGAVKGTPAYMAPEQILGEALDRRSDVYSLGMILYELCCGRRPFVGENLYTIMYASLSNPPPTPKELVPDLPDALDEIIMQALQKRPSARQQTARELQKALDALLRENIDDIDPIDHEELALFYKGLAALTPARNEPGGSDASLPGVAGTADLEETGALDFSQRAASAETKNGVDFLRHEDSDLEKTPGQAWTPTVSPVSSPQPAPPASTGAPPAKRSLTFALSATSLLLCGVVALVLWRPWSAKTSPTPQPARQARARPLAQPTKRAPLRPQPHIPPSQAQPARPRPTKRPVRPAPTKPRKRQTRKAQRRPRNTRRVARRVPKPAWASLQLDIEPTCEIFKGSKRLGRANNKTIRLKPGYHRLHCVNFNKRFAYKLTVRLKKNTTLRFKKRLRKGQLRVLSFPVDATFGVLSSGGRFFGPLPGQSQQTISLYEGRYELVVQQKKSNRSKRIRFVIKAGKRIFPRVIWK